MAAGWDKRPNIETLLQHGAKIDHANNLGETALMNAAKSGHVEILQTLVAHGASLDIQAQDGTTALIRAVQSYYKGTLHALVDAGADLNLADTRGETALTYAAARGWTPFVDYLKQHGARNIDPHIIPPQVPPPPITPAQTWAISLAAIYFQHDGHPQYTLGGVEELDPKYETLKKSLKSSWDVTDHETLLAQLDSLKSEGHRSTFSDKGRTLAAMDDASFADYLNGPLIHADAKNECAALRDGYRKWKNRSGLAFDLCRYADLVSKGYRCGYLTESEAWNLVMPIARMAQNNFASWQELGENFIDGRALYNMGPDPTYEAIIHLLTNPDDANSPWTQCAWQTDLSDSAGKLTEAQ